MGGIRGLHPLSFFKNAIEKAASLLKEYYFGDYTGRCFDLLIAESDPFRFTETDMLAVRMLSVDIPADAQRALIEDSDYHCRLHLNRIATEVTIWDDPSLLDDDGPPGQLWEIVRKHPDIGPTKTSKLLAAKRPGLIPIYDSVVRDALGRKDANGYWAAWREWAQDAELKDAAIRARDAAGLDPARVSLLRVIDVVIWMSARNSET